MAVPVPKQAPKSVPFGVVTIASDTELAEAARITEADIADSKAWVKSFQRAALVVDLATGKPARYLAASVYKRFWEARSK